VSDPLFRPDVDSLVASIRDGTRLAVPKSEAGVSMAATRSLIGRGAKDLHLVCVPTSGLQADLLIGAGCVGVIECAGVTMDEYGAAPAFVRAVGKGSIGLVDSTCPALYAGLQAAEKGLPFIPIRGLIGSDIVGRRDDMPIIDNPFAADDPIVAVKAIQPDVALFHAPLADREGNVWIGRQRMLMTMAHAARQTLVTVEDIHDRNLLDDERYGPATIPSLYISAITLAARGAWPLGLPGRYGEDGGHLAEYCRAAATPEGFAEYLRRHLAVEPAAAE
jgi:glutaconate CoA-transferase, subunit A